MSDLSVLNSVSYWSISVCSSEQDRKCQERGRCMLVICHQMSNSEILRICSTNSARSPASTWRIPLNSHSHSLNLMILGMCAVAPVSVKMLLLIIGQRCIATEKVIHIELLWEHSRSWICENVDFVIGRHWWIWFELVFVNFFIICRCCWRMIPFADCFLQDITTFVVGLLLVSHLVPCHIVMEW